MDYQKEKERLNKIGPNYFTEKAMTIDKKQTQMMISRALPHIKGPEVLELGYNDKGWTEALIAKGYNLTVIEGSKYNVEYGKKKYGKGLNIILTLFEEFEPKKEFDTIVMSCVLEHVLWAHLVLKRAKEWLKDEGVIILIVPNKLSLHRRVGYHMGLLSSLEELSKIDIEAGHRRLYTVATLKEEIEAVNLKLKDIQGIFLKPLSSAQIKDWPDDLLSAFDKMGNELLEYSAFLLALCTK